jgi:trehalose 6-phosphate phosphatase
MPLEAAKGAAIRRFMRIDPFSGRRPVFLGDDTSDESGFDTVNAAGGISIRVKPQGETAARFALEDVASAIAWLKASFADPASHGTRDDLVA